MIYTFYTMKMVKLGMVHDIVLPTQCGIEMGTILVPKAPSHNFAADLRGQLCSHSDSVNLWIR